MQSHFYDADDAAGAFEKASRDPERWEYDFATLDAFQAMAAAIRDWSAVIGEIGGDQVYSCERGTFKVAATQNGCGIAVVKVAGYEVGIDDPAAAEVLALHRYHRGESLYADQLLVHSNHVETIEQLDAAYLLLESVPLRPLINRCQEMVAVMVGDNRFQRHTFVVH